MKRKEPLVIPEIFQLETELKREKKRRRFRRTIRNTAFILITAAAAVLIAVLLVPVLRIYGSSMSPTLKPGNIVIALKSSDFEQVDIISFYYNNKVLVKRVIAFTGDWVNVAEDGYIYVNNELLDEPYLKEGALGECDIEMPYQVPEGRIFVCGDNRGTSLDSRSRAVGCVSEEQIVGKIVFRIWPLTEVGAVE